MSSSFQFGYAILNRASAPPFCDSATPSTLLFSIYRYAIYFLFLSLTLYTPFSFQFCYAILDLCSLFGSPCCAIYINLYSLQVLHLLSILVTNILFIRHLVLNLVKPSWIVLRHLHTASHFTGT